MSTTAYKHMPYEEIDEATYTQITSNLKKVHFENASSKAAEEVPDKFCDSGICTI